MNKIEFATEADPYSLLRTALAVFKKTPNELNRSELATVVVQAKNEAEIENRILNSTEAAGVVISEQMLASAVQEIRGRFEEEQQFIDSLSANGLTPAALQDALLRQCRMESVLELIGTKSAAVSEVEIGIFFHMNKDKFRIPEQRSVRHILLTINDDYAENTREESFKRIFKIAQKLERKPFKFADEALKHSECPTALQGGELGTFPKGKLYPEIDEVLFKLEEGEVSDVIETEAGFHIVQCNKIHKGDNLSLKKAEPKIRQLMEERIKRNCQRTWLASLSKSQGVVSTNK